MRSRCYDPDNNRYHRYGERGIRVQSGWNNSFDVFLADMGECPPGMTLERKNKDGNYEPSNCVWASQKDQQNNRADSKDSRLSQEDVDFICSYPKRKGYMTFLCRKFGLSSCMIRKAQKLKIAFTPSYL